VDTTDWNVDTLQIAGEYQTPFFSSPSWSPDGAWIVFATNAQIFRIKANGDSLTQLTNKDRHWSCDWSDSDSLIVFNTSLGESSGVWLMDPDGENARLLVRYGSHIDFTIGDSVFFIEKVSDNRKLAHMVLIYPVDSTTREVYRWETGNPYSAYYYPEVSPNGEMVALSIDGNIWTLSLEGENMRPLTNHGGQYPSWSPDGKSILYCKPDTNGGELWIMNADGSSQHHLNGW